ncbi:MAG: hypothetical protein WDN44_07570 [Sphingomonas sp.]
MYGILGAASRLLIVPQVAQLQGEVAPQEVAQRMSQFAGPMALIYLLSLVLAVVLVCAAFRAVLRPEEGGPGSLRIGSDEVRMAGLFILLFALGIVAAVILMLLLMLATAAAGLIGGTAGAVLAFLIGVATFCGIIFVWVRLSLAPAVTFANRRISLDAAWALTAGRFWTLLGAYILIFLITIVLGAILVAPFMSFAVADMIEAMRHPESAKAFQAAMLERQLATPTTNIVLMTVLSAIFQAIVLALHAGATATATRELIDERSPAP